MMKLFTLVFLLVAIGDIANAKSTGKQYEAELQELLIHLRGVLEEQKRNEVDVADSEAMKHVMAARGLWDDFKASANKLGKKVKNAFGRREDKSEEGEEKRQFDMPLEEKKKIKQSILQMKALVKAFPEMANDPQIKEALAQSEMMWQMLDLDNVNKRAEEEEETMENVMTARGVWADLKASGKKAVQKVKNAFGKRQLDMPLEKKKEIKQAILQMKALVKAFPEMANDPQIKEALAQSEMMWQMLDLDNVDKRAEEDNGQEKRQFDMPLEEKKKIKQSILQMKALLKAFPEMANDPQIKEALAQSEMMWQMLDLDNV